MNSHLQVLLLLLATCSTYVHGKNIVIYLAVGSKSHKFVMNNYANELVARGHQVTMISSFPSPPGSTKYKDLVPSKLAELATAYMGSMGVFRNRVENPTFMKPIVMLPFAGALSCEIFLNSPEVSYLVEGREKVDLFIIDPLSNDCAFGLAHVHKAPVIIFSTTGMMTTTASAMGLPSSAIFSPSMLVPGGTDITCVWHRLKGVVSEFITTITRRYYVHPKVRSLWEERLGRPFPSFDDLERNTSLALLNTHPAVDFPSPLFPNMVHVGGIHLVPPKPLSQDLQDIALPGFILFSLGSVTQAKDMPEEYFRLFVNTFKKLPYRVLWKFESDEEISLPPNVYARKWLPQGDLLAHPKCLAFVTHGGKLSLIEAVDNGVPMVIIPFFADQDMHAALAQKEGFGIYLDVANITEDNFLRSVISVVEDPSFREAAKNRAVLLKDQSDSPLNRAIYWTEFVIRNDGAPHLRPVARNFYWFQYHFVDVFFILMLVFFSVVVALTLSCNLIWRQIAGKKKVKRS